MARPLITRKESTRYPGLFVKKYTKSVFWDNRWDEDPDLVESRGIVEDADGNVVIRPFTKIFNHYEKGTNIDRDERCIAVQKINGFMAAATYVPNRSRIVVSTTGSLDSDYVAMAEKWLLGEFSHNTRLLNSVEQTIIDLYRDLGQASTWLFEIVDPEDPHIIPETPGAYLLGLRRVADTSPYFSTYWHETYLDMAAEKMEVKRPTWRERRFSDVVEDAKTCKHEGFVVYGQGSQTSLKIKSPHYLALKAAARIKDISTLDKKRVEEEFYPLIEHLQGMSEQFNAMEEQDRLNYIRGLYQ